MKKILLVMAMLLTLTSCIQKEGSIINTTNKKIVRIETDGTVSVDNYFIYGEYFSIKGKFLEGSTITEAFVQIGTMNFPLTVNDQKEFEVAGLYDERIALYDLPEQYIEMVVNVKVDQVDKKYSLNVVNNSLKSIDIYTLPRQEERKHVIINREDGFMTMKVEPVKQLPDNYYDIIIDPGHGGIDGGAAYDYIQPEKIYSLRSSMHMKKLLEDNGYKVALTRDGDYQPGHTSGVDPYVKNGRIDLVYKSHARYSFSNHLNAVSDHGIMRGLEVYSSIHTSEKLPRALAAGIVSVGQMYSNNDSFFKVENGVYKRAMQYIDYKDLVLDANQKGYVPYEILGDGGYKVVDYYYMIRETGGIATYSLTDGRNPRYGENINRLSQIGTENLTIEYGYIDNEKDALSLDSNLEQYVEGLVDAFVGVMQ